MSDIRIERFPGAAVVYDRSVAGAYEPTWFDRAYWEATGAAIHSTTGRGAVLMLERGAETWVLRHYHRGGYVARFVYDQYLWLGLNRSRSFREWRLLRELHAEGLPVPKPIAARVQRRGLVYRADLITEFLPDTRALSSYLANGGPADAAWPRIGAMLAALHRHGVDHPDVTAHNILLDSSGRVFLVDFDNARRRPPGAWQEAGLRRLRRSLAKVARETGQRFSETGWRSLEHAYRGR